MAVIHGGLGCVGCSTGQPCIGESWPQWIHGELTPMTYMKSQWGPSSVFRVSKPLGTMQVDGSVIAPDGTVIPAFAANPAGRNIMYECGGILAPWGGHPECVDDAGVTSVAPPMQPKTPAQPIPSIVKQAQLLNDVQVQEGEGFWCNLNRWVSDNPMLAAAGLVGLYAMTRKGAQ
jgi:hypothetical protein